MKTRAQLDFALDEPERLAAAHRLTEALPTMTVQVAHVEDVLRGLAADLGVPLAAATLLDRREQHFIATSGGPESSVRRDTTHCQYVIGTGTYLCLNDASTDSALKRLARVLINGTPLKAYMGVPLRYEHRHVVGAVCVVDVAARMWSPDDLYRCYEASRVVGDLLR